MRSLPVVSPPSCERRRAIEAVHAATAVYTSESVVDALLARMGWRGEGRLLDPSAGDGSFLLRALAALRLSPDDVAATDAVRGWEVHEPTVQEARANVRRHLVGRGWSSRCAGLAARRIVVSADFLTDGPRVGEFDFIAGNPPYLRFGHLPDFFKKLYSRTLPKVALGDLQHAFLLRCAELLPAHGVMGFVTSDRWLFNETAAKLRADLGRSVGVEHVARLDATTSFYRPKNRRVKGAPPRVHPVEVVLRPGAAHALTEKPIVPGALGEPEYSGPTLGDVAEVRMAPWLGPRGVFVVDAEKARCLPGASLLPAVDTDDIEAGTDRLKPPTRFAIHTSKDREPNGAVRRHLKAAAPSMPKRGAARPYWLPPETITLDLKEPALLIPRIARKLRVVRLPAGVLPINHNLSIVRRGGRSLDELQNILTSERAQRWLEQNAPRLEDGFFSITTKLLRRLPVDC